MKKFNHTPVKLEKIKATTNNGNRLYETPSGDLYPSITTVLSPRNKKGLMEWRKRVGEDVANHVARTAAARGTKAHHMCEDYLNNMFIDHPEKWAQHKKNFLPYCLFEQLKNQTFDNINDIYAQEAGLYSDKYKVAGRVDCIARYKGDISIIDFKTSTKERSDEWNEKYYIQGSAYAEMFEELTGISTNLVVILVVTEDGTVQEFVKQKSDYIDLLVDAISDWREQNVIRKNIATVGSS